MKSTSMAGMDMHDTPAVHGMFMFGTDTVFLSHMPMFTMASHMYQVVLRVALAPEATQLYQQQQSAHPHAVRNLANSNDDLFVLPDLQNGKRTQFKADLFPDYTNDGGGAPVGDPYLREVSVQVEQVVHFHRFDPTQPRPTHLRYLLFGTAGQAHLSHYIAKDPDFQHILSLATTPTQLTIDQLGAGVLIDIPDQASTPIPCTPPLTTSASVSVVPADPSATAFDLDLTGADTVWFSTGNLLNSTDPCPPVGPTPNGPATDFARDIAPLFRQIDIDHMGPKGQNIVDLSSPADVRDHIDDIIAVLRAKRMPPDKPWLPDKIALLEQWRTDNFPPIGTT